MSAGELLTFPVAVLVLNVLFSLSKPPATIHVLSVQILVPGHKNLEVPVGVHWTLLYGYNKTTRKCGVLASCMILCYSFCAQNTHMHWKIIIVLLFLPYHVSARVRGIITMVDGGIVEVRSRMDLVVDVSRAMHM